MASKRSRRDYTVAWICALDVEIAAAKVMLDEIHEPLTQPETDYNVYTLGNVYKHNVVVVCLPSGVQGKAEAAATVSHTRSTFPSIKFGLMVGVGGGVPSRDFDIRLGDTVVSNPSATFGGVIQYDYGKTVSSGRLERTGSLNKPPQMLLKAFSQLRSDYMIGKSLASRLLDTALEKPGIKKTFSRPKVDWLFEKGYNHKDDKKNCSTCDQRRLVKRSPRESDDSYVHDGLIGSADQVMRDAITRDSIAKDHGILCFEMEAAGIMDQLPSLVVRGICDYCDGHKNKVWQPYAALAAAAYSKAILSLVPATESRNNEDGRNTSSRVEYGLPSIEAPYFVGRDGVLSEVRNILASDFPRVNVLQGMGGIGKTQIALKLCRQAPDDYTFVFWANAEARSSLESSFKGFATKLGYTTLAESTENLTVEFVKRKLRNQRFLMVFDNLDNLDDISDIRSFFPSSDKGCILITSRHKHTIDLGNTLSVEPLLEKHAIELLNLRASKRDEKTEDSLEIVKALGCLPLGVNQAAAYIHRTRMPYRSFLDLFYERRQILSDSDLPKLWNYKKTVAGSMAESNIGIWTTWEMSLDLFKSGDFGPLKEDFLTSAGFFNGRQISQEVFELIFFRETVPLLKPDSTNSFLDFVYDASDLSLVEKITHSVEGISFSLHPLINEWLWRRLPDDSFERHVGQAMLVITTFIASQFTGNSQLSQDMDYEILGHIQQCLRFLNNIELDTDTEVHIYGFSILCFTHILKKHSRLQDAEKVLRHLASIQKLSTSDTRKTSYEWVHAYLGLICMQRGDATEAEEHFLTVLNSVRQPCGGESKMALREICSIYLRQRSPDKAAGLCLSAIQNLLPYFHVDDLSQWVSFLMEIVDILRGWLQEAPSMDPCFDRGAALPATSIDGFFHDLKISAFTLTSELSFIMTNNSLQSLMKYQSGLLKLLCDASDEALIAFEECVQLLKIETLTDISRPKQQLKLYIVLGITVQLHMDFLVLSPDSSSAMYNQLITIYAGLIPRDQQSSIPDPIDYVLRKSGLFLELKQKRRRANIITMDTALYRWVFDTSSLIGCEFPAWENIQSSVLDLGLGLITPSPDLLAKLHEGLRTRERIFGSADSKLCQAKRVLASCYEHKMHDYLSSVELSHQVYEALAGEHSDLLGDVTRVYLEGLIKMTEQEDSTELKARFPRFHWVFLEEFEKRKKDSGFMTEADYEAFYESLQVNRN